MWCAGWSLLILQKCLMFLICWLSLSIIIFIWNSLKAWSIMSMEKATRCSLESFHSCLIWKITSDWGKGKWVKQKGMHNRWRSNRAAHFWCALLSCRTQRVFPEGLSSLILDHRGEWHCWRALMVNVLPFYFHVVPIHSPSLFTSSTACQQMKQFRQDHWITVLGTGAHLLPHWFL